MLYKYCSLLLEISILINFNILAQYKLTSTTTPKFGSVIFYLFIKINTFIQQGCIKLINSDISNDTKYLMQINAVLFLPGNSKKPLPQKKKKKVYIYKHIYIHIYTRQLFDIDNK